MPRTPSLLAVAKRPRREARASRRSGRLQRRLRQLEARLHALSEIARTANSVLDPRRVAEIAARRMRDLVRARSAVIYQLEENGRTLTPSPAYIGNHEQRCDFTLEIGRGAAGRAVQGRRVVKLGAAALRRGDSEAFDAAAGEKTRHCLGAPLISRGRVIGAVEVRDRRDGRPFDATDARLVADLCEPAAIALDNARLFQRSQELSVTDDLTQLYNSRFLNNTLVREVKRARRYKSEVSLIFLDLDGFKRVNDQHGHLVGSRTLIEVGHVLKEAVREIDVVSRYGGDEFTVVLPQTGPPGAKVIADRIREAIEEREFMKQDGLSVRLTASVGVASFPQPCDSPESLLQRADKALYRIKGTGKNGVGVAE